MRVLADAQDINQEAMPASAGIAGFTLFELLIAMSLGLILLLAAVPSYHHIFARNKQADLVNHLIAAIHAARSEAVARNQVVVLCGSGDGKQCDGQWQEGQLMVLDQNQQVLRTYSGLPSGDQLWWRSSLGYNTELKLAPSGFTDGQQGSFYYCPRENARQYGARIIVSGSARVRVESIGETACESSY